MPVTETARLLDALGYRLTVTRPGSKAALLRDWPNVSLTIDEVVGHLRRGCNLALLMGRTRGPPVMALDRDGEGHLDVPPSPFTVSTPHGQHAYYRTPEGEEARTRIRFAEGYDAKLTGYCLIAGEVDGKAYKPGRIVRPEELPVFPASLLARPERPSPSPLDLPEDKQLAAMRSWIRQVFAIQGSGGDKNCFRVAVKIVSVVPEFHAALAELAAWNATNADPPFSEKEMTWKIQSALNYRR